MSGIVIPISIKGGAGSGNWGHAGRPGLVGGSASVGAGVPSGVAACGETDWANKVRNNYGRLITANAKYHKMSVGEYTREANAILKQVLYDSKVVVRVTEETLEKIMNEGRFKTQRETGTSGGGYDPKLRDRFERDVLGVAKDEDAPVYGYITQRDDGRLGAVYLDQYGGVAVYLKDSAIRDRTTFTNCDSLDTSGYLIEHGMARLYPSPIANPSIYSMFSVSQGGDVLGEAKDMGALWPKNTGPDSGTYWEAQIHNGVQVADIDKVVFASQPNTAAIDALKSRGIPWSVKE